MPRSWKVRVVAAVVIVVVALVASFLLTNRMIHALRGLTGGGRAADAIAGVLLVLAPLAAMIGYTLLARRRGWPTSWAWWLLVLYLPALALEPFGRSGTNTELQHKLDTQLPGFLGGMLGGWLLLVAIFVVPAVVISRRKQPRRPGPSE